MRLPFACQVASDCFSFTPVPQTDIKHFYLESFPSFRVVTWPIDANSHRLVPEPESHGYADPQPAAQAPKDLRVWLKVPYYD